MVDPALAQSFAADVVLLRAVGLKPVVVHGGGPQIGELLARLGKETEFRDGLRVTDAETLDVARMVLVGKVNRDDRRRHQPARPRGRRPLGRGRRAHRRRASATPTLGFVGDVVDVDRTHPRHAARRGLHPGDLHHRRRRRRPGLQHQRRHRRHRHRRGARRREARSTSPTSPACSPTSTTRRRLISRLSAARARLLIADGVIAGGMIPKVEACLDAVEGGVGSAHILDGRIPHVVLLELFTDAGRRHHDHPDRRRSLVTASSAPMAIDAAR